MLVIQLKKTDYNTKTDEIDKKIIDHNHEKYITTPEFNKLTAENLAQANLVTKADINNELINLNKTINSNKTKHVLVENEFKKLQTFHSIYFVVKDILKMMALKIIQYFSQHTDILKELVILMIIFQNGDLKDYLIKVLKLLLHLLISLILY